LSICGQPDTASKSEDQDPPGIVEGWWLSTVDRAGQLNAH
jgi:hypothetical protein